MKILCFRNSRLGDFLISIPAIKLIKKKYPDSKIYFLTDNNITLKQMSLTLKNNKLIHKFIFYRFCLNGIFNLFKYLKKEKFDYVYNLQDADGFFRQFRNFSYFHFCGCKKKKSFFYRRTGFENNFETLQLARRVSNNINLNDIKKIDLQIKEFDKKPIISGKYITISPGGNSSPCLWSLNNWKLLITKILNFYKIKIIIVGNSSENIKGDILKKVKYEKIQNYCGKTNIDELFNIIKHSSLHITNDNGSMHVATLFKKKTICLFNNHDPKGKWFPLNENANVVWSNKGIKHISHYKVFKEVNNFF